MSHYVYLISDYKQKKIHAGHCENIGKAVGFYNELNGTSLHYPPENYLNRLVYFEEVNNEGQAINQILYFSNMPLKVKQQTIEEFNPTWIDLSTASNFNF